MNIGMVIAGFRWAHRINIRDLAKELGVSSATLSRIECGKSCDGDTLAKIISWMLGDHDAGNINRKVEEQDSECMARPDRASVGRPRKSDGLAVRRQG